MGARITSMLLAVFVCHTAAATPSTLELIKRRGHIKCGVNFGLPGFSSTNKKGTWQGIDVDFCRALSAAVLGDAKKVKFTPLSAKERFTALQSGEIDVLSRNTTWTISRDVSLGLDFVGVTYYDGQGFMIRKDAGVKSAKELDGATVCVNLGTTTELNLADYFLSQKMTYKIVAFEKNDEVTKAYDAGRCDVLSNDQSGLYATQQILKKPADHMILPEIISKEPLGPSVRQGDDQWADIVRWTLYALLEAEELGISSKNVKELLKSSNPNIKRLLGVEGSFGKQMGLDPKWAYKVIQQMGNYGQLYEKNLGQQSPLKISRGLNKLWRDGGLHYAMPFR